MPVHRVWLGVCRKRLSPTSATCLLSTTVFTTSGGAAARTTKTDEIGRGVLDAQHATDAIARRLPQPPAQRTRNVENSMLSANRLKQGIKQNLANSFDLWKTRTVDAEQASMSEILGYRSSTPIKSSAAPSGLLGRPRASPSRKLETLAVKAKPFSSSQMIDRADGRR